MLLFKQIRWAGRGFVPVFAIIKSFDQSIRGRSVSVLSTRYFLSLGNVFFSLILGALALAFCWIYFPEFTLALFKYASSLREWIFSQGMSAKYEVMVRALVDDRQIVYMGFVLLTRVAVSLLLAFMYWLFGGKRS